MAKRFTDTDKWKDDWFLNLEPAMKILWVYITDTCDHAGFWKVNFRLASYCLNSPVDRQSALNAFVGRVDIISPEVWFIKKFIRFQYGVPLNLKNNAHRGVIKVLESHKIETSPYLHIVVTPEPLVTKSFDSLGDKEQEQDKDKDKDNSFKEELSKKERLTPDHIVDLWNALMSPPFERAATLGGGVALKKCLESLAFVKTRQEWVNVFDRIKASNFLLGQNKSQWKPSIVWATDPDNIIKLQNGAFKDGEDLSHLFSGIA